MAVVNQAAKREVIAAAEVPPEKATELAVASATFPFQELPPWPMKTAAAAA